MSQARVLRTQVAPREAGETVISFDVSRSFVPEGKFTLEESHATVPMRLDRPTAILLAAQIEVTLAPTADEWARALTSALSPQPPEGTH